MDKIEKFVIFFSILSILFIPGVVIFILWLLYKIVMYYIGG